jgi:hypothetical protein
MKKMATTEKPAAEVVLGEFTVKAVNDGGAEARLSDEKNQSKFVGRLISANKQLVAGQKGQLIFRHNAETPKE